jgi:tRNA(fMet)-specific endonuclease VapC
MIVLDSDHLSILRYHNSERALKLIARLEQSPEKPIATSIANVEEAMRGWLSAIAKERRIERQIFAYRELGELFTFFSGYTIALLDANAAQFFNGFRKSGVKIATMDLKTACIAMANNALLLTANRRDFTKVPGLRFENWLE